MIQLGVRSIIVKVRRMNRVLVTGASGFIGSYTCRALIKAGFEVVAIKRENSQLHLLGDSVGDIEWHDADLFDVTIISEILGGVDYVVHSAGKISIDKKEHKEMMRTNVEATRFLVDQALSKNIKKFILLSSVAAIGRSQSLETVDEESRWVESEYNSDYGFSKMLGEQEVWRGQVEGLSTLIINPSYVIGAGYWKKGTSRILGNYIQNKKYYPTGSIGLVDVRDVAKIIVKAIQSEISGERFIVCSECLSFKELFTKMANELGFDEPSKPLKGLAAGFVWRFDKIRSFLTHKPRQITKALINTTATRVLYNNEKSRLTFNYDYIPIDQAIKDMVNAYVNSQSFQNDFAIYEF